MNLATLIMAAGLGKRMNSDLPKVLHIVDGKPMVEYCIELSERLESERILIVVGYQKEKVIDATRKYNVEYVVQEPQLGTGHAALVCEESLRDFNDDVLVLYGDVPLLRTETMKQMIQLHRESGAVCTVLTANLENPFNYGRVIRGKDGFVAKIVEEKDATPEERLITEINSGIYVFRKKELFEALHQVSPSSVTGEYYLTSVFDIYTKQGLKVNAFIAENANEILGVNTVEQLDVVKSLIASNEN